MNRALVIADDLSGAAEIAGIGWRYGLVARIVREPITAAACPAGLTVIDSDSRSLEAPAAAGKLLEFIKQLHASDFDLIFKKTDSVLRGPIAAEVQTLLAHFGLPRASLLAQNPSRGRIIDKGTYFIDGVPLHQTAFAQDPQHPARSSDVRLLIGKHREMTVLDAVNLAEVRQGAARTRGASGTLPAGGADFFEAVIQDRGLTPIRSWETRLQSGSTLFVCGSASAYRRKLIDRARAHGLPLLAIEQPMDRSPDAAEKLLDGLVDSAVQSMRERPVANLMLEGGSTASAVCRRMGWNQFEVCGELATGVVHLRAMESPDLYIKPGSYPWPNAVWKEN